MGRKSQAVGRAWQNAIAAENTLLSARRQAHVFEVPAPFARVGAAKGSALAGVVATLARIDRRYFVARKESPVAADYAGTLKGGRAVYFEAKSVDNATRFDFANLTATQRSELEKHAAQGALTFVYVERRDALRRIAYLLPVAPGVSRGGAGIIAGETHKASIAWTDAEAFKLAPSETWYQAAIRLELHMESA